MDKKRIAIMQPYVFPYIGYFHLIHASSLFVFYDDVNYIKQGWINRNRILNQDEALIFTIPVSKASPNKQINQVSPVFNARWESKFYKQLVQNYGKAPYFKDAVEPVMSVFTKKYDDIAGLAIATIVSILSYLDLEFNFTRSSVCCPETKDLDKADRLINIIKRLGYSNYVNPSGGKKLYSKDYFFNEGINLSFVESHPIEYGQYQNVFVPWLSIIDVIMFCDKRRTIDFMTLYSLV
jgi:hypothetical protein